MNGLVTTLKTNPGKLAVNEIVLLTDHLKDCFQLSMTLFDLGSAHQACF